MKITKLTLSALLLLTSAPLALAQGTYTQIDEPNAVYGTYLQGIDGAGDIVGFYIDANINYHGFLLSGSTYTTIDYPAATDTLLYGVNDVGQIVGFTSPAPNVGFLYDVATQTFTIISYPGVTATFPYSINNTGAIAGTVLYGKGAYSGFEVVGSNHYRPIKPPRATDSHVYGISASGELAGYVHTIKDTNTSFLFKHG